MPAGLISWLSENPNCIRADLFQITLPNGQIITATDGQNNITVPSGTAGWVSTGGTNLPTTTFYASQYGRWARGAITSEASFNLSTNTMDLTCIPQPGTAYPGLTAGMLQAAANGLFDGATLWVWTAYMPIGSYGTVSNGIETKFQGTVTKLTDLNRVKATFECGDPLYLLNMKVPSRTFQPMCPWSVGDSNCTLNLNGTDINGYNMTQAFTAASGSTQWVLTPTSAFLQPSGYFTQGVVTCTSGDNNGLSQTVKVHSSGALQLMNPFILPVNAGDTFSVIVGCDHTLTTCISKFGNSINHGATPFTPPSSTAI